MKRTKPPPKIQRLLDAISTLRELEGKLPPEEAAKTSWRCGVKAKILYQPWYMQNIHLKLREIEEEEERRQERERKGANPKPPPPDLEFVYKYQSRGTKAQGSTIRLVYYYAKHRVLEVTDGYVIIELSMIGHPYPKIRQDGKPYRHKIDRSLFGRVWFTKQGMQEDIARREAEDTRWDEWERRLFQQRAASIPREEATNLLGLTGQITREEIITAFRQKVKQHHPDHGGDADQFQKIVAAKDQLLRQLRL